MEKQQKVFLKLKRLQNRGKNDKDLHPNSRKVIMASLPTAAV